MLFLGHVMNAFRRKVESLQDGVSSWGEVTSSCSSGLRNGVSIDTVNLDDYTQKHRYDRGDLDDVSFIDSTKTEALDEGHISQGNLDESEKDLHLKILRMLWIDRNCPHCCSRNEPNKMRDTKQKYDGTYCENSGTITGSRKRKLRPPTSSMPLHPENRGITPIRHIHQDETWDCGLASIQMILQWLRRRNRNKCMEVDSFGNGDGNDNGYDNGYDNSNGKTEEEKMPNTVFSETERERNEKSFMIEFVGTESIWTIDLVMLLDHLLHGDDCRKTDQDGSLPLCFENYQTETSDSFKSRYMCPRCRYHNRNVSCENSSLFLPSSYVFCSTQLGVDESYNKFGYYKEAFSADELRVKQRFEIARNRNLPLMQVPHLSLKVLVNIVSRKDCVAVVLLDNWVILRRGKQEKEEKADVKTSRRKLKEHRGGDAGVSNCLTDFDSAAILASSAATNFRDMNSESFLCLKDNTGTIPKSFVETENDVLRDGSYAGHYVVLCGISRNGDHIDDARNFSLEDKHDNSNFCMVIKNPGNWNSSEYVTPSRFERAWRAKGTDEDIIFISKHSLRDN